MSLSVCMDYDMKFMTSTYDMISVIYLWHS